MMTYSSMKKKNIAYLNKSTQEIDIEGCNLVAICECLCLKEQKRAKFIMD